MKMEELLIYVKAGYTPKQCKEIMEYKQSVEKPEDILAFVKAGWKPDDIRSLITETSPQDIKNDNSDSSDPFAELKKILEK